MYVVTCLTDEGDPSIYGPFAKQADAQEFCDSASFSCPSTHVVDPLDQPVRFLTEEAYVHADGTPLRHRVNEELTSDFHVFTVCGTIIDRDRRDIALSWKYDMEHACPHCEKAR